MVNDTLDQFKNENLISRKAAERLKAINPETPKFYITPKILKDQGYLSLTESTVKPLKFHTLWTITLYF